MRIRLLHSYKGRLSDERRLAEGEHEVTKELGEYLIANGHAVKVASVTTTPEPTPKSDDVPTIMPSTASLMGWAEDLTSEPVVTDYSEWSLDELRAGLPDGVQESDIVADMDAHWQTRRAELIAWFEHR